MLKATQTRGFDLENRVLRTLSFYPQLRVRQASKQEDRYHAIDLFIASVPVQLTLQNWDDPLKEKGLMAKIQWTQQQSEGKAIVVAYSTNSLASMWPAMTFMMVKAIMRMRKDGRLYHVRIDQEIEILVNGVWENL